MEREIAEFRARWRLKQPQLADRLGVHRVTIAKWENERMPPKWVRLALKGLAVELAAEFAEQAGFK